MKKGKISYRQFYEDLRGNYNELWKEREALRDENRILKKNLYVLIYELKEKKKEDFIEPDWNWDHLNG